MPEPIGKLVVEVYAVSEENLDKVLIRRIEDEKLICSVMNWAIANDSKDGQSQ